MSKLVQSNQIKSIKPWQPSMDGFEDDVSSFEDDFSGTFHDVEIAVDNALDAETAKLIEEARQQGFEEGKQLVETQTTAAGGDFKDKLSQLEQVMQALQSPLREINSEVEESLKNLVLSIVRHLFRGEIESDPQKVLSIIQESLALLPSTSNQAEIHLSTVDAEFINNLEEGKGYNIVSDPQLQRGDCKVISGSSQVDATLESRLKAICGKAFHDDD